MEGQVDNVDSDRKMKYRHCVVECILDVWGGKQGELEKKATIEFQTRPQLMRILEIRIVF